MHRVKKLLPLIAQHQSDLSSVSTCAPSSRSHPRSHLPLRVPAVWWQLRPCPCAGCETCNEWEGSRSSSPLSSARLGSVQVWPAHHPTARIPQDAGATPAAAEEDGSLSLSGSNRDDSADDTLQQTCPRDCLPGTKTAAILDIFGVSKRGIQIIYSLHFCRIADVFFLYHMILCHFKTCRLEIIRPITSVR